MIYYDKNALQEGRMRYWRVFANTASELRAALSEIGAGHVPIREAGKENEHAVISTAFKNKLRNAQGADDKLLVKLFRSKRRDAAQEDRFAKALAETADDDFAEFTDTHASDRATHDEPAYPAGDRDCDPEDTNRTD